MANSIINTKKALYSQVLFTVIIASTFISVYGTPTDTIKKVNGPFTEIYNFPASIYGMTIDKNGILYFADTYSKMDDISKVYMLSPPYTGTPVATDIESQSIAGLMWHKNRLYAAFLGENIVMVYDKDLEFEMSYEIESPWSFTNDGKEVFVVNYFGALSHISKRGRISDFIENLDHPFSIQYNGEDAVWISEHAENKEIGNVMLYDYNTEIIDTVNYTFQNPAGLAMDHSGVLFITDTEAGKIVKVSPSGRTTLISDQYQLPLCITIRHDNTVFINCDDGLLLIYKNN